MNESIDPKDTKLSKDTNDKKDLKPKRSYSALNFIFIALLLFSGLVLFNVEKVPNFFANLYKDKVDSKNFVEDQELTKKTAIVQATSDDTVAAEIKSGVGSSEVKDWALKALNELESAISLPEPMKNETQENEHTQDIMLTNLNEYRLYLANANRLIVNFMQNKTYSSELASFRKHNFPERVDRILYLFDLYNKYLVEANIENNSDAIDLGSKILNKFVKVKKIPENSLAKNKLREEIIQTLDILIEYIFSTNLQDSFLKK